MSILRFTCNALAIVSVATFAAPAFAQNNVSDITGPNVSDITGPNVSDITGPNASDITGTNAGDDSAQQTNSLNQGNARQLADDLGAAYSICSSGGDCSTFFELYEQSNDILGN